MPVHTPAGPSGNVISPSGGSIYNIRNSLIQFTYNETFTEEIETRDVAVYLIRESTDLNVTLGTDMNAVYDQWWHLPAYLEAADDYSTSCALVAESEWVDADVDASSAPSHRDAVRAQRRGQLQQALHPALHCCITM